MTRYLKFLTMNGTGPYSGFAWPLPRRNDDGTWTPGRWVRVEGAIVACERGLHATTPEHALAWLDATCYEVQFKRRPRVAGNKVVGREARLIKRLNWDERVARLFAADCAERVLPLFEREHPGDDRPRAAIATARRFARGEATRDELAAAGAASLAAAGAASAAAEGAVWNAAWAARAASLAAAEGAVWEDAARAAEHAWQTARLLAYLNEEIPT